MIKFYSFSNLAAKRYIENAGWKCSILDAAGPLRGAVGIALRRSGDYERLGGFLEELSRRYTVYIVLMDEEKKTDDEACHSPDGRYLTVRESQFLYHYVNDDVVKKTLVEMDISKSCYYKMLNRILGKLDVQSAEQLKIWALIHLCL